MDCGGTAQQCPESQEEPAELSDLRIVLPEPCESVSLPFRKFPGMFRQECGDHRRRESAGSGQRERNERHRKGCRGLYRRAPARKQTSKSRVAATIALRTNFTDQLRHAVATLLPSLRQVVAERLRHPGAWSYALALRQMPQPGPCFDAAPADPGHAHDLLIVETVPMQRHDLRKPALHKGKP